MIAFIFYSRETDRSLGGFDRLCIVEQSICIKLYQINNRHIAIIAAGNFTSKLLWVFFDTLNYLLNQTEIQYSMCYRELNPPECKSRDAMLVIQSKSLYSFLVMMDGYNLCNIKQGPMCLTLNFTVSE